MNPSKYMSLMIFLVFFSAQVHAEDYSVENWLDIGRALTGFADATDSKHRREWRQANRTMRKMQGEYRRQQQAEQRRQRQQRRLEQKEQARLERQRLLDSMTPTERKEFYRREAERQMQVFNFLGSALKAASVFSGGGSGSGAPRNGAPYGGGMSRDQENQYILQKQQREMGH